ncbi:hypothetical protein [Mesorhizobium sp. LCM 4577]|uniref:hypothetical protein n=1 Tax=Mesorhizobium sp. LCM 4577 TaxID=1848288 RepID=UPI000B1828F8|nr:hypothetical protein [Mesorhizobium sp. LCM 4577]
MSRLPCSKEITQRVEHAAALRGTQLQRARYEAELARRRYLHERQNEADRSLLDEPAQECITALAADFPRIWKDERTGGVEHKRMLGLSKT